MLTLTLGYGGLEKYFNIMSKKSKRNFVFTNIDLCSDSGTVLWKMLGFNKIHVLNIKVIKNKNWHTFGTWVQILLKAILISILETNWHIKALTTSDEYTYRKLSTSTFEFYMNVHNISNIIFFSPFNNFTK